MIRTRFLKKGLKELCGHFIKRGFKLKVVDSQILKARTKSRESLLCQDARNRKSSGKDRMLLVIDFHPALSGISKIIDLAWPVLHASEIMKKVFGEKPNNNILLTTIKVAR